MACRQPAPGGARAERNAHLMRIAEIDVEIAQIDQWWADYAAQHLPEQKG